MVWNNQSFDMSSSSPKSRDDRSVKLSTVSFSAEDSFYLLAPRNPQLFVEPLDEGLS